MEYVPGFIARAVAVLNMNSCTMDAGARVNRRLAVCIDVTKLTEKLQTTTKSIIGGQRGGWHHRASCLNHRGQIGRLSRPSSRHRINWQKPSKNRGCHELGQRKTSKTTNGEANSNAFVVGHQSTERNPRGFWSFKIRKPRSLSPCSFPSF